MKILEDQAREANVGEVAKESCEQEPQVGGLQIYE
jgi:hypothetical protein